MGLDEHIEEDVGDCEGLLGGQAREPVEAVREVLALEQLHDQEDAAVVEATDLVNARSAGVGEALRDATLTKETLANRRRGEQLSVHELHRDAIVATVSLVDRAHAAHGEKTRELDSAGEGLTDSVFRE
jgi:hypothetical protein